MKNNLNDRRKAYWAKLDKNTLDTALEKLGIPKEVTANVKSEYVKQSCW